MRDAPDLVVFGNLLVDDIVLADGQTLLGEPGGAVLHTALAASLWGCRVGIVSVVGTDYPEAALDGLTRRGVELGGIRRLGRPGGRAWLLHEPSARRVIHHLDCPTHGDVSPVLADLPPDWRSARAAHLAPMPLDRQHELAAGLARVAGDRFVSLDPFELIRDDTASRWQDPLAHVDALFAGLDDLRLSAEPATVLPTLVGERLRLLVLKRGEAGGDLLDLRDQTRSEWPARAERVVDVTGAGDAFAGGFLAGWVRGCGLDACLAQGVVSASFAVADWGSRGLARATPAEARDRFEAWFPAATQSGHVVQATR